MFIAGPPDEKRTRGTGNGNHNDLIEGLARNFAAVIASFEIERRFELMSFSCPFDVNEKG